MYITSETCRANSVIKTALNNLHQAGPNSPYMMMHGNTKLKLPFSFSFIPTPQAQEHTSSMHNPNHVYFILVSSYVLLTVHPRTLSQIIQLGAQFCL